MQLLNHLDLNKLEIRNAVVQVLATAPTSPVLGQVYFDSSSKTLLAWNGTAWVANATNATNLNGQGAAYYLARANHSGTQLASTISDLASTVQAYRLDQFAAPTTSVSFNGQRISTVSDPSSAQDAATKAYVDAQVQSATAGIDSKASVRVVATANLTLSGAQTIDGVSCVAGDRVLATGQTTASANGVYVVAAGAWSRATDADQTGEITPGAFWFVEEGGTYGKTQWRCNNVGTVTLGTTSITIVQFGAASSYTASNGVQLVGSDFELNLAASSGLAIASNQLKIDTSIVARKYAATVGNGSATTLTVTHGLGTSDVVVMVRDASTGAQVIPDITVTDANNVSLTFASAPAANAYKVAIIG